jgi:hypothetical protein
MRKQGNKRRNPEAGTASHEKLTVGSTPVTTFVAHPCTSQTVPGSALPDFLDGTKPKSSSIPYSKVYIQTKIAKEYGDAKDFTEWVEALDKELQVAGPEFLRIQGH